MNTLRENAPAEIGGYKVTAVRDYKKDTITDTATGVRNRPVFRLPMFYIMSWRMMHGYV